MRNILLVIIIAVIVILTWILFKKPGQEEGQKQKPIAVSKHTAAFNSTISNSLNSYSDLTESFVNWDSLNVKQKANGLKVKLDSINLSELQKDSSGIYQTAQSFLADAKINLDSMAASNGITSQRLSLNALTQNLYDFLRVVKYDLSKLYLQECPMAFNNETEPGVWLSKVSTIHNPYMGIHHPHYGKGMIECGETKDSLNFMNADKTEK
jgi:hypothetical protein